MAQCLTPYSVCVKDNWNPKAKKIVDVQCGKCPNCISRRVSNWSFRLMQEYLVSTSAYFVTLTYNTSSVPISGRGFMTLNKRDCQLFMKRLRKKSYNKIKYYLCGEYGSQRRRPHYHIILFNATIEAVCNAWTDNNEKPIGDVHFGEVNQASVGYTLKYISKQTFKRQHKNDDRLPEFALMSKGLGINYLTPRMIKWHKANVAERCYCNIEDGKKISMPRYYKKKIYEEYELDLINTFNNDKRNKEVFDKQQELGVNYEKYMQEKLVYLFSKHKNNTLKRQKTII